MPAAACPTCGKHVDGASNANHNDLRPEPGDLAVCVGCGTLNRFTPAWLLEAVPASDEAKLHPEDQATIGRIRDALARMRREGHVW